MDLLRFMQIPGFLAVLMFFGTEPAFAQETDAAEETEEAAETEDVAESDDLLSEDDLDLLVAPVALYPDTLLAQIVVAATFPLEIIKADRFVKDNVDTEDSARMAAAEEQGWDPSVAVLAGGFPTVVGQMAENLDWTEEFGNAVVVQTDDVLDAVQRQRARAVALGNLETNEAQEVAIEDEEITIEPADPEVVYVPSYDSTKAYTEPVTAAPVTTTEGYSGTDVFVTGALAFGAGMIISDIFDDDDDWDDYWRHAPPPIGWGGGGVYPRPGVNIDGDVNVDIDRSKDLNKIGDVDRDRIDIGDRDGKWEPDKDRKEKATSSLKKRDLKDKAGKNDDRSDVKKKLAERESGNGAKKAAAAPKLDSPAKKRKKTASSGKPKKLSKPKQASGARKKTGAKSKSSSAFKRKSGGNKARAASKRGGKSRGSNGRRKR